MICAREAMLANEEFCPSTHIIEQLDICMEELEIGTLQPPSESEGPFTVCRSVDYPR